MNKFPKQKNLLSTCLLLLLVLSICIILTANVQAAEMTTQQKVLAITTNVLGIDTNKYEVSYETGSPNSQVKYMDLIPQESIIYHLTSNTTKTSYLYTFTNGSLQMIQALNGMGLSSSSKQAIKANTFAAQDFLTNYQKYTNNQLFNTLKSTLYNVDSSKNLTKTTENLKLEVTALKDGVTNFKWYYTSNEVIAPYSKFISLGFKDGCLHDFVDNWQFYNIGNTKVTISKTEAIAIALDAAKSYVVNIGLEQYGFKAHNMNESCVQWASLIFDDSIDSDKARSDDALMLYPDWRIGIALDKWYYGNLYGIEVNVWADTGQVRCVQEARSTIPSECVPVSNVAKQTNSVSEISPSLLILVSGVFISLFAGTAFVLPINVRKRAFSLNQIRRKVCTIILSVLLFSIVFISCAETVNATSRGAVVWGSESAGGYGVDFNPNGPYNVTWRKHPDEVSYQQTAASYVATYFGNGGYSGNSNINHQGTYNLGSSNTQIYNDFTYMENNKDVAAFVTFDHGVTAHPYYTPPGEQHHLFEDQTGTYIGTAGSYYNDYSHAIFDMDVYSWTQPNEVLFAFINTCQSAYLEDQEMLPPDFPPYPGRPVGMALGLTHRLVESTSTPGFNIVNYISDDGYNNPDWGQQVYIGFPWGSAALAQYIPYSGSGGYQYIYWVVHFFYYALSFDVSVNDALDYASSQYFGTYGFVDCPLKTGFTAIWPMWNQGWYDTTGYGSTMAVYGNGNIHLRYYTVPTDAVTARYVTGPSSGDVDETCEFSAFATDPYAHDIQYRFDWGDGSAYTETGWYSDGVSASASHSWSSGDFYNVRIQARCSNSGWSDWSEPLAINIGNQPVYHWLTVSAVDGTLGYPLYPDIYIDGDYAGYGSVSVQVLEGDHSVWMADPTWNGYWICWSYLSYYSDYYGNGDYRPVYSDTEIFGVYY